jgi:hypothetical protein
MILNERVVISGSGDIAISMSIDEQRVRLHRKLKRIAKARGYLDLQEAEALREAQKVQLWKEFGHTSLVDYMVNELGYSSWRTAEDRLRLANALPALPKLTEAIQAGELNMSQARELVRVATPETEEKWIAKALDLNVRQVEQAVTGHSKGDLPEDPVDPRLVRKTMYLSVRPETEILFREARKALEAQRGEKLDDDAVIEALCLAVLRRRDSSRGGGRDEAGRPMHRAHGTHVGAESTTSAPRPRAVAESSGECAALSVGSVAEPTGGALFVGSVAEPALSVGGPVAEPAFSVGGPVAESTGVGAAYRVAVTVCEQCRRGWQHGAGAVVELSPAAVERATCDAQWIGNLDSTLVERARQDISPATRRKVLHRDQNRCRVPGCQSHNNLDIHHIVHREHGGTNDLWNLLLLCESHHLAHHNGTLQIVRDGDEITFTRQASNRFTRTTREVATREELRRRGFSRDVSAGIMKRTISIVGETDLTEEQWLTIALRCASDHSS